MSHENLTKVFDLTPVEKTMEAVSPVPGTKEEDVKRAREVHHKLLNTSTEALDQLLEFAKSSESPRAFEVVSNLIRTTSEVAKTLVDLNNSKKEEPTTQTNTQNNIFVGSTAELQKLIKDGKLDRSE